MVLLICFSDFHIFLTATVNSSNILEFLLDFFVLACHFPNELRTSTISNNGNNKYSLSHFGPWNTSLNSIFPTKYHGNP